MYSQVFSRLAITSTAFEVSQAVALEGSNAIQVEFIVFAITGASALVSVIVQESNDLENWKDRGGATTAGAIGYSFPAASTGIAAAYVRLKVSITGTSPTAILSAGINTASL